MIYSAGAHFWNRDSRCGPPLFANFSCSCKRELVSLFRSSCARDEEHAGHVTSPSQRRQATVHLRQFRVHNQPNVLVCDLWVETRVSGENWQGEHANSTQIGQNASLQPSCCYPTMFNQFIWAVPKVLHWLHSVGFLYLDYRELILNSCCEVATLTTALLFYSQIWTRFKIFFLFVTVCCFETCSPCFLS